MKTIPQDMIGRAAAEVCAANECKCAAGDIVAAALEGYELAPFELEPAAKIAVSVATSLSQRGESVGANTATVVLWALERATRTLASGQCPVHDDQAHGLEAEELRKGIERLEHEYDGGGSDMLDAGDVASALRKLLDDVDARDSLAYRGRRDAKPVVAEPQPDAPTDVAQLPDYWDARRKAQGKPDTSRCAAELRVALGLSLTYGDGHAIGYDAGLADGLAAFARDIRNALARLEGTYGVDEDNDPDWDKAYDTGTRSAVITIRQVVNKHAPSATQTPDDLERVIRNLAHVGSDSPEWNEALSKLVTLALQNGGASG